jgi:hypothetical protein
MLSNALKDQRVKLMVKDQRDQREPKVMVKEAQEDLQDQRVKLMLPLDSLKDPQEDLLDQRVKKLAVNNPKDQREPKVMVKEAQEDLPDQRVKLMLLLDLHKDPQEEAKDQKEMKPKVKVRDLLDQKVNVKDQRDQRVKLMLPLDSLKDPQEDLLDQRVKKLAVNNPKDQKEPKVMVKEAQEDLPDQKVKENHNEKPLLNFKHHNSNPNVSISPLML